MKLYIRSKFHKILQPFKGRARNEKEKIEGKRKSIELLSDREKRARCKQQNEWKKKLTGTTKKSN